MTTISPLPREGDIVSGTVWRVARRREESDPYGTIAGEPFGLLVNIGPSGFIPRSLIPREYRADLDQLVGKWMKGVVRQVDEERSSVVIEPSYFGEYIRPPKSDAIAISDTEIQFLIDNLRGEVPSHDSNRFIGSESARNILVALAGEDCGQDADSWERLIRSRRTTSA
jgi:hypothetical protein